MFTFTYDNTSYINDVTCDDREYVSFVFKNEMIEIKCCPESCHDLFEDGYDSAPWNGEFRFYYDKENITFTSANYDNGQAGCLTITLKMTKEISESLEKALNEWRAFITKIEE